MQPIKFDKKTGIFYRQWGLPSPKATLLLVHGFGGHSGRWIFMADFFLKHGFTSYAIELRGFGETKGLKGHIDSFNTYLKDICSLRNIIAGENPAGKIFLVGESVGALISFLLAGAKPSLFSGLICISPAFRNKLEFSALDYVKMLSPLIYNPKKQFKINFSSEMCTRDREYQKTMDSDPMEHRFATSKLLSETLAAQARAKTLRRKPKLPMLFLVAGDDKMVDPEASRLIFNSVETEDKLIMLYPDMRHALSVELGREAVFEDMLKWLKERI